jgi:protein-S-isoprenylcysteine O-methyltransferase Ste14
MTEPVLEEKNGEHPFGHTGQLIAFVLFMAVWVADSFFGHWSTFPARYVPLAARLALLGLALLTAVSLVRSAAAVHHLEQLPDHVVTAGPFRRVRHPIYLGVLLVYLGMVLATASLLSLAILVSIFFFYNYIAGYEEKLLEARFGQAYRDYAIRTGKWIPGIGRRKQGRPS